MGYLRTPGIVRLFLAGLATYFCVASADIGVARERLEVTAIDLEIALAVARTKMAETE